MAAPLAAPTSDFWIDARARLAHGKALIIDCRVTIMGGCNFSVGAARNSEDLNIATSPAVAKAYAALWQSRIAGAVRLNGRAEWCR